MTQAGWKYTVAAAVIAMTAALLAPPAAAQGEIVRARAPVVAASALRFNGVVAKLDRTAIVLRIEGQHVHLPIALTRFSINGVDVDPARLQRGMAVTASVGTVRGTIAAIHGTIMTIVGPNGVLQLPASTLQSPFLAQATVAFRDVSGQVSLVPVATALELEQRRLGAIAVGADPFEGETRFAIVTPDEAVVVTPEGIASVSPERLGPQPTTAPAQRPAAPVPIFTGPIVPNPITFDARIVRLTPTLMVIDAKGVQVEVPLSSRPSIKKQEEEKRWRDLSVGDTVRITMPTVAITKLDATRITYELSNGSSWTVPTRALPADYTETTWVWIRPWKNRYVRVQLRAAMDMLKSGAIYAPNAMEELAVPPEDIWPQPLRDIEPGGVAPEDGQGGFDAPIQPSGPPYR